jgi:NitT/TauT family transport system substrate-binding protein
MSMRGSCRLILPLVLLGGFATPAMAADTVHAIFSSTLSNAQLWSAYLAGKERGIYAKYGIDIEFSEGQGGGVTSQVIANGRADIGLGVSASSVVAVDDQGGRVKMIATDLPVAAIAILSKPPKTIDKPQDLVGTTIGIPPGTSQALAWPGFLAANHIDPASVKVINVPLASMRAALLQNQYESYLAYSWSNVPLLKGMSVSEPHTLMFSDFGVRLAPDSGIIVKEELINTKPDMLKRFVAASTEAWEFALSHPQEAAEAGKRVNPQAIDPAIAVQQITLVADIFRRNAIQGKPLMWMSPEDWAKQVKSLTDFGIAKNPQSPTMYYTNALQPEQ